MRGVISFRLSILLALLLLALVGLGCGGEGEGGLRLLFYSDRDGDDDVYIAESDGSGVRQLTDEPGRDYEADSSPDGRTIVFASQRAGENGSQLYLMNADGSNVRRLTFSSGEGRPVVDDYGHWSPDGWRIVFQRTTIPDEGRRDADIWLVEAQTGEETQLTDTPDAWDSTPGFGADDNYVLFESNRDGDFDLYRLDLQTMEVVQLVNEEGTDRGVKESPDRQQIVFASDRDGDNEVYIMDLAEGGARPLTENDAEDLNPHWSPDGTRILFDSDRDGDREIYVMNADGSDQRRLITSAGKDVDPHWARVR